MVSIAEVYAHLSIECPSGFLQAEVVVQLLVRKVPALEREVVASATETVGKAQVVGELARNHVVALVRTDFGRIIGKAVQVLVVVRYSQRIAFFPEVAPVEGHVGIGKDIRQVGHAFLISYILRTAGYGRLHIVAHVHLREVAAHTQPPAKAVAGGDVISLRQHLAVIDVSGCGLAAAQVGDVALDVVFGVTVDKAAFHVHGMFAESLVIAQVQVDVVAVLRPDADVAHFQVLIAEHLFDGGQAVGLFIGQLGLQSRQDEVSARRSIAYGMYAAGGAYIVVLIGIRSHRSGDKLVVMLAEYG